MKKIYTPLLVFILTTSTAVAFASETKYYTDNQYPYNRLIARTDSVKIIYSEKQQGVQCKVSVNWQGRQQESTQTLVSKSKFESKPLTSCLPRALAKSILAETFD